MLPEKPVLPPSVLGLVVPSLADLGWASLTSICEPYRLVRGRVGDVVKETCQFSVNLKFSKTKDGVDVCILEGNEPKPFAAAGFSVQHDR